MISTGDPVLDNALVSPRKMTIGFFNKSKELPAQAVEGNRAIVIESNTTYEYVNGKWIDLECFILPMGEVGPKGEKGDKPLDGKDGASPSIDEIVVAIKKDENFIKAVKGEKGDSIKGDKGDSIKGEKGEKGDISPIDYEVIINSIKNDKYFIEKIKGDKGEKGDMPTIDYTKVVEILKSDENFINTIKGAKGDKGDTIVGPAGKDGESVSVNDVIPHITNLLKSDSDFLKSVKGDKGLDGRDGMNGVSPQIPPADRIFIGFSPDGFNDWTSTKKEGDKFISFELNRLGKNIFQIIN